MRDTSQKGLISHTAVLNRLVQLGFEVLLPWADHLGYDLANFVTEEYRQVKTAWLSKDGTALDFNTSTVSAGKRGNKKPGYAGTPVNWARDYEI